MFRILSLTLALLIAVTSQQMAAARGMAYDASGQVILCTGQGVVTVTLNAQGEPLNGTGAAVHICPDCALSLMVAIGAPTVIEPPVIHSQTLGQTTVVAAQTRLSPTAALARGPPLTV